MPVTAQPTPPHVRYLPVLEALADTYVGPDTRYTAITYRARDLARRMGETTARIAGTLAALERAALVAFHPRSDGWAITAAGARLYLRATASDAPLAVVLEAVEQAKRPRGRPGAAAAPTAHTPTDPAPAPLTKTAALAALRAVTVAMGAGGARTPDPVLALAVATLRDAVRADVEAVAPATPEDADACGILHRAGLFLVRPVPADGVTRYTPTPAGREIARRLEGLPIATAAHKLLGSLTMRDVRAFFRVAP